jgi:hypothetical protein
MPAIASWLLRYHNVELITSDKNPFELLAAAPALSSRFYLTQGHMVDNN